MFGQVGQGGLRFQLFGFPVRVDPSFWIVTVLLGLSAGDAAGVAIWVGVVFVSILAHELGHAMMGRRFGLYGDIALYSMGGVTSWVGGRHLRPWQSIAVSLAGPLTGLVIGGVTWAAVWFNGWPEPLYAWIAVRMLLWVNLVWALANLLPIEPLDGGHIMASAVHWIRRYEDPALPLMISVIFGIAVAVLAWKFDYLWGAMLAGFFTVQNFMRLRQYGPIRPRDTVIAQGVLVLVAAGVVVLIYYVRAP